MSSEPDHWEVAAEVQGEGQAEILGGLLKAQGIQVLLSQEGAGKYGYATTFGKLGQVQILVPDNQIEQARSVLTAYQRGEFEQGTPDFSPAEEEGEED